MNPPLVISNGHLIDPKNGIDGIRTLVVEDGKITSIHETLTPDETPQGAVTIDATGQWVTPGLIDLRTHLREPGEEWKETVATGARAALVGGFTSICASPDTFPVNDEASVTNLIRQRGEAAKAAKVYPIAAATNAQKGETIADIGDMKAAGAVAVSNGDHPIESARMMRRVMEYCLTFDMPLLTSSFDMSLTKNGLMNEGILSTRLGLSPIPAEAEVITVAREIELAALTGAKVHLGRLSTEGSVRLLQEAQQRGLRVTGEVTPHHLTLTQEALLTYNTNTKMVPPLRTEQDRQALIRAVADGVITCISTDHAPQNIADKELEFVYAQPGAVGLELCFSLVVGLVNSGALSPATAISALTCGPANVLQMETGSLEVGATADIAIFDPTKSWTVSQETLSSLSWNTPFLGKELTGKCSVAVVDGEIRYQGQNEAN